MELIIILFGGLIIAAGILMLIKPTFIFDFLKHESGNRNLHLFAIIIRLIMGIFLILFARNSAYPTIIEALGWFTVIAAVALILIGRKNFQQLIDWAVTFLKPYSFIGGLLAIVFGSFLIYAFI